MRRWPGSMAISSIYDNAPPRRWRDITTLPMCWCRCVSPVHATPYAAPWPSSRQQESRRFPPSLPHPAYYCCSGVLPGSVASRGHDPPVESLPRLPCLCERSCFVSQVPPCHHREHLGPARAHSVVRRVARSTAPRPTPQDTSTIRYVSASCVGRCPRMITAACATSCVSASDRRPWETAYIQDCIPRLPLSTPSLIILTGRAFLLTIPKELPPEQLMPYISMFFGIIIRMFYNDHPPPHFHAEYQGQRGIFDFDGNMTQGTLTSRTAQRLIREWTSQYREELEQNWHKARAGETLHRIAPLR